MADQQLANLIVAAGARLRAAMSTALAAHGLTLPQYEALASVVHAGSTPIDESQATPMATETLVRDLEPRGLVDSTYGDGDEPLLHIRPTDAGVRIEQAATAALDQLLQQLLQQLGRDEKDHLAAALERCNEALRSRA